MSIESAKPHASEQSDNQILASSRARSMGRLRIFTYVCFALLFVYLYLVGSVGQPPVHQFYDEIVTRDSGTVWHALTWNIEDKKLFFPVTVMRHIEGPLQFFALNLYYHLVGNIFPLNPATTQFPNTVLMFGAAIFAYLIGRKLLSKRFGIFSAIAFILMPWLASTIRRPELFTSLSCLLEFSTLYYFISFVLEPERRLYRLAAPLSLAIYWLTGLDWPSFFFILVVFLTISGRLMAAIKNRYNLIPLSVVMGYVVWTGAVFYYGKYISPLHARLYQESIFFRPFMKVGSMGDIASFTTMFGSAKEMFWLSIPLALLGLGTLFVWKDARMNSSDRLGSTRKSYVISMGIWMILFAVPLFKGSPAMTYGYVIGIPIATLAGLFLARLRMVSVIALILMMAGFQWFIVFRDGYFGSNDSRVLAAAAFLNEERPDLLTEDKTALLPRNKGSNVGQYARGRNERLVMPINFPSEGFAHSVSSDEVILRDFVDSYNSSGQIRADWLVMTSELLSEDLPSAGFYRRLMEDPQISWIARFENPHGENLWLGEVKRGGPRVSDAPMYDMDRMADLYKSKYDRIDFLKKNVTYVFHTLP